MTTAPVGFRFSLSHLCHGFLLRFRVFVYIYMYVWRDTDIAAMF